jgi:hypothetical protein
LRFNQWIFHSNVLMTFGFDLRIVVSASNYASVVSGMLITIHRGAVSQKY